MDVLEMHYLIRAVFISNLICCFFVIIVVQIIYTDLFVLVLIIFVFVQISKYNCVK